MVLKQKLAILKAGSTLPSIYAKKGDFEHWILSGMNLSQADALVLDLQRGAPLPEYDRTAGVVITGSHAMVTEHQDWSERAAGWLPGAAARGIPILGICYGHQLLAYAFGGEVGDNPNGREFGTVEVHLDGAAHDDALLGGLPTPLKAHAGHTQAVLHLPDAARRLAYNEKDSNHAFTIGNRAWGVQFHPEFDSWTVSEYIHHYRALLRSEGQDPDKLISNSADTPSGSEILKRFAALLNLTKV